VSRFAALLALSLAAGCSGMRAYQAGGPDNVFVSSAISKMRGTIHIHGVDAGCRTEYLGSVALDRPDTAFALPPGRPSYLVFSFDGWSLLGGSSSMSVGTLLEPRAGYRYGVDVAYRDNIYNVTLRESDPRRGAARELARRGLSDCNAL
jgi:hypothetical protein